MATHFQTRLFKFISDYIYQQGRSPSFAEITKGMGISPRSKSLISRSLRTLEKEKKLILIKKGRHLSISLSAKNLPLLGQISAGVPIEAIPQCQWIDLNSLLHAQTQFFLKIKDNSMIEEGIFLGDIILCRQTNIAKAGDIILASIDQQNAILTRILQQAEGRLTLAPINTQSKPCGYAPERIQIQGVYLGLIRTSLR